MPHRFWLNWATQESILGLHVFTKNLKSATKNHLVIQGDSGLTAQMMTNDPDMIRAERYLEIGTLIRSDASEVIDKWSRYAQIEQDSARSARRHELRNHLPLFLEQLGLELATRGNVQEERRNEVAEKHGKQRWDVGWRLDEVVRDYQLLRITLLDHLDDRLERTLNLEEVKAVGLLLDDAIEDAVGTYVAYHEQHLSESEERSRETFENAAVGIGQLDGNGRLLRANRRLCEMLGYSPDQIAQTSFDQLTHFDDKDAQALKFDQLLNGDADSFSTELRLRHRDGSTVWTNITASVNRSSNPNSHYFILIIEDISERRRLDAELQRAKADAEEASRVKSEFVANVSHEIRTPMNAILGMTELALDEQLAPDVRDYLKTAHDSAKSLLSLVNDLLDFSRMEAGKLELESSVFDLWQIVDETARAVSISAVEKGLEVLIDVGSDVPRYVKGDSLRLRQIITNLVGNAIKFTERGEVAIKCRLQSEADSYFNVHFSICDTGIGISDADKQRIFAPFTQADASTTRVFGGSGLGLAICSELIAQLGGKLDVKSTEGEGSDFSFTARLEKATPPREFAERRNNRVKQLRGCRTLIVDDNQTARNILRGILEPFGVQVDVFENGESALDAIPRAAQENRSYDFVIVDALMPGVDGFEVIKRINNDVKLDSTVILMLSSVDRSTFNEQANELNIDGILDKPVGRGDLLEVLSKASSGPDDDAADTPSISEVSQSLRVLMAEDTPANQKVVQAILRKRGHEITLANNGREAIDKLFVEPFDVVLMDVQMPTVDGYQATKAIRMMDDKEVSNVPIIAMTAHAMKGDAERCFAAGMNDYISKPIDARRLIELVENWGYSDAKEPEAASKKMKPSEDVEPSKVKTSRQTIANFDAALNRLDGNKKLLMDMIGFFREDIPQLVDDLESAVADGHVDLARRAAHSIKGQAAGFGANQVVHNAQLIERLATENEIRRIEMYLPDLKSSLSDLESAFKTYEDQH